MSGENTLTYFLPDLIIWVSLILAIGAQIFVKTTYKKFAQVKNKLGLTGKEVAEKILLGQKIKTVKVVETKGVLSDHYDPQKEEVALSSEVYAGTSVAAVAVAAHECGHVIQNHEGFVFLRWRSALVPFINFSSYAGYIAIMIGLLFGNALFWVGILFELAILGFQLVTLPVEFDASKKALKILEQEHILQNEEMQGGEKVLKAAAFTYVASVATALLQIVRLVLIFNRRDD